MPAHDTLFVLVSVGMIITGAVGWRVGQIMSPRPRMLREAAQHHRQSRSKS
jgi:hypothetical protein